GTAYPAAADSGTFAVVNRSESPYGAGWWPAGLERLDFPAGSAALLWVGGDGSTREYVPVPGDSAAWAAEPVSRPDTIRRELLRDSVVYVRTLSGGTRVEFHADGRHRATVNRLGHRTRFEYVGGSDSLSRVLLPVPAQDTTHHYHFTYGAGRLTRVELHAAGVVRGVGVGYADASKRIASLTDPDTVSVAFAYDDAAHPNRITARTDRRGTVTAFAYDAAGKVAQGTVDPAGLALATTLAPQQSQGLSPTAADPAQAYTRIDGPRADVLDHTRFWLDRFGAPEQVQDAYGQTTTLLREDPTYP
ncbi:MAG: RHS repeat protein, partial [Actinobacteria bacterium]|nr:RHS repeat protein [Actinomycetota bacterium]